jgi:hypothetical protein
MIDILAVFCQYSTGANQLIGLMVVPIICRGGKRRGLGTAGWMHPCSGEKKIARRWQDVLPNLRSISHAHQ